MKFKRVFLIILDSLGVGEAEDAANYGDAGANTLGHIKEKSDLFIPNLKKIGFLDTLNMQDNPKVDAYYTIAKPNNAGKDTLNGHYEMMGITNNIPFKTFNSGFPTEILAGIEDDYIINELGDRQLNYGSLIIYTSADSDLQVAAHEDIVPVSKLYEYCEKIRAITLKEDWRVGRVIARPFVGQNGVYKLNQTGRKDYALKTP